ncbi:thiol:disulfide interchange protein DsbA/DsbL [Cognatilysobacter tabacisoli]|uniref:thiol:disulfide interchange protein DsbA/DsbL n=1 Tax=Cognatilysobacter tabacisoli TaxID=2315424 RepID=UPI000E6B23A0|nr:thiol:disulfide interchange protein DsbA/DsbL [Lysobacter tabacisoli]
MTHRPALTALLFALLLPLAACTGQQDAAPTAATPAAPTATPAAPAADAATAATPAPAEIVPAATATPPQGPAPVAGTDYVEIAGGQPLEPTAGQVEVVEVFGYTCPHCASFEPLVNAWRAKQTADVRFTPVAAPFGGYWTPYARAYYAAQTLGLASKTHDAMFRAIHVERSLPVQPVPTNEQIAAFYAKHGADAQQFASTMSSFAVDAKLKRAEAFITRSGVDSTPTLVVNGKYRVTGKTLEDNLRITDHLVAQERAAAGN